MSELAAFAVIGNIRRRIIEYGQQSMAQERVDELLAFCGLPATNERLYSLSDVRSPPPEVPIVRVYVIAHRTGGVALAKVGISQDPETRCKGLAAGLHSDLFVYATTKPYTRAGAGKIERLAHAELIESEVGGEWFSCGPELAWRAVLAAGGDVGDVV